MCFWTADYEGISLWLDVRSGGVPVQLGDRRLHAAEIVQEAGQIGQSAFSVTQALCKKMCSNARLPTHTIYGTNDWNFAYGNNSAALISSVSKTISDLSPNKENRPFSVIDEGWAMGSFNGNFGHGPWIGNPRFGDMGEFASQLKGLGVRPGIWFKPLTPLPDSPDSWRLSRDKKFLDPTLPGVQEHISLHLKRLVDWGYELIKHDFTTWDILGLWGFEMGGSPTQDGWSFHTSSKTNAEVLQDLYKLIREEVGNAILIGCNTVGHLVAGTHEVQRIGDDTSGRSWNRYRRMGVNTLAFRAPQHEHLFLADPDIVALTKNVPWNLVRQWLELVSKSGNALFVALDPEIVSSEHHAALQEAFAFASTKQMVGEPLDWMNSVCPRKWLLRGRTCEFNWMGQNGAWPFGD